MGRDAAAGYEVSCELAGAFADFDYVTLTVLVGADGRFRFDGLPAGPVDLSFTQERPYMIFSSDGVAVDRDDHRFVFEATAVRATVHGTVHDRDGVPLAGVAVAPWHPDGADAHAITDRLGNYRIRTVVTADSSLQI